MSREIKHLLDEEKMVGAVFLADDAVEDFLNRGDSYDVAKAAESLDLGPYYSNQTLERIPEDRKSATYEELRTLGQGYEERSLKRTEEYEGEQRWQDQVEIAKFPGGKDNNVMMISERDEVRELADDKDFMFVMSPEEAVESLEMSSGPSGI